MPVDLYPRGDHGPGWRDRVCRDCGASWVGHQRDGDEWCPWCDMACRTTIDDQRAMLLRPEWLQSSAGDPRYDQLPEEGKAVWDATRGQARGTDAVEAWVERLGRAVKAGLTRTEAEQAMRRAAR